MKVVNDIKVTRRDVVVERTRERTVLGWGKIRDVWVGERRGTEVAPLVDLESGTVRRGGHWGAQTGRNGKRSRRGDPGDRLTLVGHLMILSPPLLLTPSFNT